MLLRSEVITMDMPLCKAYQVIFSASAFKGNPMLSGPTSTSDPLSWSPWNTSLGLHPGELYWILVVCRTYSACCASPALGTLHAVSNLDPEMDHSFTALHLRCRGAGGGVCGPLNRGSAMHEIRCVACSEVVDLGSGPLDQGLGTSGSGVWT